MQMRKLPTCVGWQRRKIDHIGKQLGIQTQGDWYNVTSKTSRSAGASQLLNKHFSGSIHTALKTVYPEFEWKPFLFSTVPLNHWKSKTNQREMMDWIAEQLGIETQTEWYGVSLSEVNRLGAGSLLHLYHNNSLSNGLQSIYPEFDWNPGLFSFVPQNLWKESTSHKALFDWIAEELGVETQQDWYTVSASKVRELGASGLLVQYYNDSLSTALKSIYPYFDWIVRKKTRRTHSIHDESRSISLIHNKTCEHSSVLEEISTIHNVTYEKSSVLEELELEDNKHSSSSLYHKSSKFRRHRRKLDELSKRLGIEKQEDWYLVTGAQVKKLEKRAKQLIDKYNGSLVQALQQLFPEFQWHPFLFQFAPRNQWKSRSNQREAMDWLSEQLGIETQDDWYDISGTQVRQMAASSLLHDYYGDSLPTALESIYPEFEWNSMMFRFVPQNQWKEPSNRRQMLESLAKKIGVETQSDWYLVTATEVKRFGGRGMFHKYYKDSLFNALESVYSEYEWNPLLCVHPPHNFLSRTSELKVQHELNEALESLPISRLNTSRVFARLKRKHGGTMSILQKFFPDRIWNFYKSNGEATLEPALRTISSIVERETRIAGNSIDFYMPNYSIAIEFQGRQHYQPTHTSDFTIRKIRDSKKRVELKQAGITLIEIPYWWNGSYNSLMTTLQSKYKHMQRDMLGSA